LFTAEVPRGYVIEEQHERLTTDEKVGKCVPGKRFESWRFQV
jgi:hypothetical protein